MNNITRTYKQVTCVGAQKSETAKTVQHTETHRDCNALQLFAAHCNTMQHATAQCSTLQHTTAHYCTLQHPVAHCNNALQRAVTQCSTLSSRTLQPAALWNIMNESDTSMNEAMGFAMRLLPSVSNPWPLLPVLTTPPIKKEKGKEQQKHVHSSEDWVTPNMCT